jgi:PKD repeat protein
LRGRRQLSFSTACAALAVLAVLLAVPLACHQRAYNVAASDAGSSDAAGDLPAPLTLDISVTGCAAFDMIDANHVVCSGPAPLRVSFAPVGSAAFTSFRWTFGDGTASSLDRGPSHTYALPGSYDVSVTGKEGDTIGTASQLRPGLIDVRALTAGAACDIDGQCNSGLRCLCGPGDPATAGNADSPGSACGPAFTRGICSTACTTGFCGPGAVCAATALGTPASAGDAGNAGTAVDRSAAIPPICLADCAGSATCAAGFVCQTIPGGGGGDPWIHGCLPLGARNDFGSACRDANGVLHDDACTTGLCADIGALGLCSAACDSAHPCPAGAACAHLAGTAELCLPACSAATPCARDPSLGCTVATNSDAGIDGGLTITAGDPGVAYCALR